jgi:hypothetical protein
VQFGEHATNIEGLEFALFSYSLDKVGLNFSYSSSGDGLHYDIKRYKDEDPTVKQFIKLDEPLAGLEWGNSQGWSSYGRDFESHLKVHAGPPGVGAEISAMEDRNGNVIPTEPTLSGSAGARFILGLEGGYDLTFGKKK